MTIKEAGESDLPQLLELYTQLHNTSMPEVDLSVKALWSKIVKDTNHHVLVMLQNDLIISSCVLIIVPNLTHSQRPYALLENVITHKEYRCRGYATAMLTYARNLAQKENCYKIMLMTGSKKESTLHFYERAGYNRQDKTAFIQWL